MARIVIAGASEAGREQLNGLLASSGFSVFRMCASGSELRRTINECEDGIVILMGTLPGCKPDELQWDYGERLQILLIGKPIVLEDCESPEIFRLPIPVSGQAVIGAVNMLSQLHQMRLPKRSGDDKQIVEQAKELLMRRTRCSEPEAHRAMQQYAMRHGMKMADYAKEIIASSRRTEE
ncbi:MAG: ANTAR domain-containing protein [Clostridia bacterium]|nr:ANTAR domain-containing protein [Clostridia bacterium]